MTTPKARVRYWVTFEFDNQPPVTVRGTVVRSETAGTMCRRAVVDATAQRPGTRWQSLVVGLDRSGEAP